MILTKRHYLAIAVCTLSLMACGGNKDGAQSSEQAATPNATVDLANGATITGTITADGAAPAPQKYPTAGDAHCKSVHPDGVLDGRWIINNGKVANAFIYIKDGLGNKVYAPPADVITVDQKGCIYYPRVFGAVIGQKVKFVNSDQTLHNVHSHAEVNAMFNYPQQSGSEPRVVSFDKQEIMVPIMCDVHGWMKSYAGVLPHPFFAVSDSNGQYAIKGIPPGEYTIECWHEPSDTKSEKKPVVTTQKITVAAKESKTLDFTIKPE